MKTLVNYCIILFTLSSCAFHSGNISSGDNIDCPLTYISTGTATTTHILGIGGLSKNALILEAKKKLHERFPYKKGIKLTNYAVDYKTTFAFIFSTTEVTVSAEVYDCNVKLSTDSLFLKDESIYSINNGFRIGDSLLYSYEKSLIEAKLSKYLNTKHVFIDLFDKNGELTTIKVKTEDIFKIHKDNLNVNYFGFNIGEEVFIDVINPKNESRTSKKCKIAGLNNQYAVVEYLFDDGELHRIIVKKVALKK